MRGSNTECIPKVVLWECKELCLDRFDCRSITYNSTSSSCCLRPVTQWQERLTESVGVDYYEFFITTTGKLVYFEIIIDYYYGCHYEYDNDYDYKDGDYHYYCIIIIDIIIVFIVIVIVIMMIIIIILSLSLSCSALSLSLSLLITFSYSLLLSLSSLSLKVW